MDFRIKEARERVGLSQKDLAKVLNIKPTTFNGYETGAHDPKSDVLVEIAKACNTTVDFLLGLTDKPYGTEKTSSPTILEVGARWQELQSNFNQLNEAGQDRLVEFSEMLLSKNEYKAGGESPESSSGETVRVFMAARSTDNTPPKLVDMPKEEVERIFNAPESDLDL